MQVECRAADKCCAIRRRGHRQPLHLEPLKQKGVDGIAGFRISDFGLKG